MSFFTGTPGKFEQRSTLLPNQQAIQGQQARAIQGRGAGGAFGESADYYRDLLSNQSADLTAFQAPELRRFQEEIIPDLAEQFAGMGSGGLSSSGFRNAGVSAGADLGERLASIRAGLRQSAADRLSNMGQQGLNTYAENYYRPRTPGFLESAAPAIGGALGSVFGPAGTAVGGALGSGVKKLLNLQE